MEVLSTKTIIFINKKYYLVFIVDNDTYIFRLLLHFAIRRYFISIYIINDKAC